MLEATTRIYVRDPERADDLVPGVVSEVLGQKVMVRFLQPVAFEPGIETVVFYHNETNCFTKIPCQMQRMFSKGQYPTGALILDGEHEVAENRASFRVDIHDQRVSAKINREISGEVVNISCGGIALMLDTESFQLEKWVQVTLAYDCGEHAGRMQVRSKFKDKSGRFRYGLMADTQDANIISQLTRITQEIQSLNAQRASRLGTCSKTDKPASVIDGEQVKNKQSKHGQAEQPQHTSPDGTKRMHQRNPWPGMAKIYVREEGNIRVISAETEDLSRGGISFTCPQYIYEGTEVLLEKPIEGGFFRVVVVVRNARVLKGKTHRIGAQFVGAPIKAGEIPKAFDGSAVEAA